jgi:glycosyltransferase involved in cell wall biosynthesis
MMNRKVLFVTPSLEYGSVAAQSSNVALGLPADRFERRVFVLGNGGPLAERLRDGGVAVEMPGRGRTFDLKPLARLRELVKEFAPGVVHAWGLASLRAMPVSGFKRRLIASPCPGEDVERTWLRGVDRWLLKRAHRVIAFGETETGRCERLGVTGDKVVLVRPAVWTEQSTNPAAEVLQEGTRFVLCVGKLEMHKGFAEAVWAHDILRYIHPDLHLVIVGEGPDRERIEGFARGVESGARVHLPGAVADVGPLMRRAEVVWAPGRRDTGTQVILEAMAAGRPVVASRWPRAAELVVEGETGFLVPPEDKAELARQTQRLLNDAELRARMGDAARQRVEERHRVEALAETCVRVYEEVV